MIEAIIGAIIAVVAVIFSALFRQRGEKIKDLENELDSANKQSEIYKSNMENSKPIDVKVGDEVEEEIKKFNSGFNSGAGASSRMQDDKSND